MREAGPSEALLWLAGSLAAGWLAGWQDGGCSQCEISHPRAFLADTMSISQSNHNHHPMTPWAPQHAVL